MLQVLCPSRGAGYCDVYLCVCLRSYLKNHELQLYFLCLLPLVVAWSTAGGVAVRYVYFRFCFDDVIFHKRTQRWRVLLQQPSCNVVHELTSLLHGTGWFDARGVVGRSLLCMIAMLDVERGDLWFNVRAGRAQH